MKYEKYIFDLDLLQWFEIQDTHPFGYKVKPSWGQSEYSDSWYISEDECFTLSQIIDILLTLKDLQSIKEFKTIILMYGNTTWNYDEWVKLNEE